ncbi:MAG: site-specific integrase [Candidatus Sulfotelmatobacter sp.]
MSSNFVVQSVRWDRYPVAAAHSLCRLWLTFQSHRGLARNTLDAYSQGLEVFLRFLSHQQLSVPSVTRVHIGAYLASLQSHKGCLSNATVQQRLTVLRLFYTYLVEEGVCQKNPTAYNGARALVPRHRKVPWVPNEDDWRTILAAAAQEPIRNRVMLTFAYDAGLRREEPMEIVRPFVVRADLPEITEGVHPEWARLCRRWLDTSTVSDRYRRKSYYFLLNVGRWLANEHPEINSPADWTRELAAEAVAVTCQWRAGDCVLLHQFTSRTRATHLHRAHLPGESLPFAFSFAICRSGR